MNFEKMENVFLVLGPNLVQSATELAAHVATWAEWP
jgi:hypothetical protein